MNRHRTYTNPVWPEYFADPFVVRWEDRYVAYGTGPSIPLGVGGPLLCGAVERRAATPGLT